MPPSILAGCLRNQNIEPGIPVDSGKKECERWRNECYSIAAFIVGVDIDPLAVKIAKDNAEIIGVEKRISWIISDIDSIKGHYDTVLQNPPFGVHHRGADMKFLEKAMDVADVIYSLHKSGKGNRKFISNFVKKLGREIIEIIQTEFEIPPIFEFHRRRRHTVIVDLYRVK